MLGRTRVRRPLAEQEPHHVGGANESLEMHVAKDSTAPLEAFAYACLRLRQLAQHIQHAAQVVDGV